MVNRIRPVGLVLTGFLLAFGMMRLLPAMSAQGVSQAERNKQLLVSFFADTSDRPTRAQRYLTEDYVQHNPRVLKMDGVTHATGRDAWVKSFAAAAGHAKLVENGGIPLRDPVILLADGDLVTAIYRAALADPDNKSQTYDAFTFETFRVRDGRLSEHWDAVQLSPGWRTELEKPKAP